MNFTPYLIQASCDHSGWFQLVSELGRRDVVPVFHFMTAIQATYPIETMAKTLGVSCSGFYAWRGRLPSAHSIAEGDLTERIGNIHAASNGTYGTPRIHVELADEGIYIGRKRVERLMKTWTICRPTSGGSAR